MDSSLRSRSSHWLCCTAFGVDLHFRCCLGTGRLWDWPWTFWPLAGPGGSVSWPLWPPGTGLPSSTQVCTWCFWSSWSLSFCHSPFCALGYRCSQPCCSSSRKHSRGSSWPTTATLLHPSPTQADPLWGHLDFGAPETSCASVAIWAEFLSTVVVFAHLLWCPARWLWWLAVSCLLRPTPNAGLGNCSNTLGLPFSGTMGHCCSSCWWSSFLCWAHFRRCRALGASSGSPILAGHSPIFAQDAQPPPIGTSSSASVLRDSVGWLFLQLGSWSPGFHRQPHLGLYYQADAPHPHNPCRGLWPAIYQWLGGCSTGNYPVSFDWLGSFAVRSLPWVCPGTCWSFLRAPLENSLIWMWTCPIQRRTDGPYPQGRQDWFDEQLPRDLAPSFPIQAAPCGPATQSHGLDRSSTFGWTNWGVCAPASELRLADDADCCPHFWSRWLFQLHPLRRFEASLSQTHPRVGDGNCCPWRFLGGWLCPFHVFGPPG